MMISRAVSLMLAAVVVGALAASYLLPLPHPSAEPKPSRTRDLAPAKGLGPATSFAGVVRGRQRLPLDARQNTDALAAVGRLLDRVGTLAPEPGGIRLLTELRLNEYLLDVTVWSPQSLDVGGTRLNDVSGIMIPFTGAWRNRILIDRGGTVVASPPFLDNPDLAALERLVEASGRQP